VNNHDLNLLNSFQSNNIKRVLGLPKRSHHSKLVKAISIEPVSSIVFNSKLLLYNRIFKRRSPARAINVALFAYFLAGRECIVGTLLDTVSRFMSPIGLALSDRPRSLCLGGGVSVGEDGVVDSLKSRLLNDRYGNPGSAERGLVKLLVRASFFFNF
jgi:hypothetical protein